MLNVHEERTRRKRTRARQAKFSYRLCRPSGRVSVLARGNCCYDPGDHRPDGKTDGTPQEAKHAPQVPGQARHRRQTPHPAGEGLVSNGRNRSLNGTWLETMSFLYMLSVSKRPELSRQDGLWRCTRLYLKLRSPSRRCQAAKQAAMPPILTGLDAGSRHPTH